MWDILVLIIVIEMKQSIYSVIYGEDNIYEDKGGVKKEIQ